MLKKSLFILCFLFTSTLYSQIINKEKCKEFDTNHIFAGNECIQFFESEGEEEGVLNIIVHGTWDEGTNTLGRYSPFAETISMSTDITTIAIALPGYSNSSTNNFKALSHNGVENLASKKEYLDFLSKVISTLKTKYNAKKINYIGHSAGGMMGATLTGLYPDLIDNLVSVGGRYDIHEINSNKSLISVIDVLDKINKNTNYLLIYGEKDKISKPEVTIDFYKIALKREFNIKIVEVRNAVHLDLDMTDTSVEAITEFLTQ